MSTDYEVTSMKHDADEWNLVCVKLARRLSDRARRQTPPPSDAWEGWSRRIERMDEFLYQQYFPSDGASLVIGSRPIGFADESDIAFAWRDASNRMKRGSELWVMYADRVADPWGRWCTSKAVNAAGGRLIRNDE